MRRFFGLAVAAGACLVILHCGEEPGAVAEFRSACAAARQRPSALRMASFPFAPPPRTLRGTESPSLSLRAAAYALLASPEAARDVDARTAALLVVGDHESAARALKLELARDPREASKWNDYAVALYETAIREQASESLPMALAATDRAIALSPAFPEAICNRAAVLEALQLREGAKQAWTQCQQKETVAEWRDDARAHIAALSVPTAKERWQEGQLLRAALTRGDGREAENLVRQFRQESRTWCESQVLAEWADSWLAGNHADAAKTLAVARDAGAILERVGEERLLHDAVAAIDDAVLHGNADNLAKAHLDYRTARMAIARRVPSDAIQPLLAAEDGFGRARSPMLLVTRYYRAAAIFDAENYAPSALVLLREIEVALDPAYRALFAQVLWERSRIVGRTGDLYQSLDLSRRAMEIFDRSDEHINATRMRTNIATALALLGRRRESWQMRPAIFGVFSDRAPLDVERALSTLALSEIADRQLEGAGALLNLQLSYPSALPLLRFEAHLWRAFLALRGGESVSAKSELAALRTMAERIPDAGQRDGARDDLRFAEALAEIDGNPARAVVLLSDTIAWREAANQTAELPAAYVQRAAAERKLNESAAAARDLERALDILEERRTTIRDVDLRDTFFDSAQTACAELLRLHARNGEDVAAFEVAERCRARGLVDTLNPSERASSIATETEIRRSLPASAALLHYNAFADETLLFVLRRNGLHMVSLKVGAEQIERMVAAKTALLPDFDEALIAPVADALRGVETLIIVPDAATAGVPFAALPDRATGRPLVRSCSVISAPSASYYARAVRVERPDLGGELLVVGDPAFDANIFSQPRLPAAAAEARAIASLYRRPLVLTGGEATTERLFSALPECDVAHIATHALISERDSSLSVLLTAKTATEPGVLYPPQISALRLTRAPLVILAGCRTAATGPGRGAIRGFANSFLSAGSRAVIATLWDVEDRDAMIFSRALHGRLRSGQSAVTALRETQLEMLDSANSEMRRPEVWGAFQLYGTP